MDKKFVALSALPIFLRVIYRAALLSLFSLTAFSSLHAGDDEASTRVGDISVTADNYEFNPATGWTNATGNVRISYRGLIIEADNIKVNAQTKEVEATDNVYFYTMESIESPSLAKRFFWSGESLKGNFDDPYFESGEHQVLAGPWYVTGGDGVYHKDDRVVFHNVTLSTCEHVHTGKCPHYSLNAKKVVYTPEGKIKAYHTWYKVGPVPIFYWPYVVWDTERDGGNISYRVGYDSDWGGYILASRKWRLTDSIDTTMQLDWRSKRGFAIGNRTTRRTEKSQTDFMVYALKDDAPPQTDADFNRRFDIEDERYRLNLYHWQDLGRNLTLRLNLDMMSDIDFLEEWFEDDYENYRQPRSYLDLRYDHERFTASLSLRPRVNDFYTVVERLPELKFDFPRQAIPGVPGLLYEGETSFTNLRMNWRSFDRPRAPGLEYPADYDTLRLDSLHMFYLPLMLGGDKLRITPRGGLRFTYYDKTSATPVTSGNLIDMYEVDDPDRLAVATAINQYDEDGGSVLRVAGEAGVEVSTKFYRVWDNVKNDFWKIDGLRHVIQPFINYTYIPEPSEDRDNLYFFDLIDRITEQNFIRVGANQRLQTRHPDTDSIYTVAEFNTYADFHLETPGNRDTLGDLGIIISARPRRQVSLTGKLVTAMDDGNINRAEAGLGVGSPDKLRVDLSYLFRDDYATDFLHSMGSTLSDYTGDNMSAIRFSKTHYATLTFRFPLSSKMDGYIRYEYDLDESDLARQIYQVTRDLHCWVGGLRFEEKDGEAKVQAVLYLKAFPSIGTNLGAHQTGL